MRFSIRRGIALTAVAGLVLAGCGDDEPDDAAPEEGEQEQALEDLLGEDDEMADPNEDVEDGVYRGNGVILPVPEGWEMEPAAFQQGIIAAVSEDRTQQLTAQAIDAEEAETAGQPMDLDTLIEGLQQQIEQDAEVDEEVELSGAARAHRLTYLQLPARQEGQPESSATIVIAEDGEGMVGEFALSAASDDYDEAYESVLLEEAGFDPDSEPAPMPQPQPQPQPAPEGDGEMDEMPDDGG